MISELRPALVLLSLLTLLTGLVYPLALTGLSQVIFPEQANGSLIRTSQGLVGSALIGQSFTDPRYFWGRPSATSPMPNNAAASSGSNLGPLNPALIDAIRARVDALHAADPTNRAPVPVDLVTASASGLDPDISPAAAFYQVGRVAQRRGLDAAAVRRLVQAHVQPPQWGLFGEARVNVLRLNQVLDRMR